MDYKDIKKLMDDMGNSKLDSLEIEFPDGIKISMTKNSNRNNNVNPNVNSSVIEASAPMTVPTVQVNTGNSLVSVPQEPKKEENLKVIKSPMVGTFYSSSSPDK